MDERQFYEKSDLIQRASANSGRPTLWRRFMERNTGDRFDRVVNCLETGEDFLDLGCGGGEVAVRALNRYGKVNGVDIASNRLSSARELCVSKGGAERVGTFLEANLNEPLPFSDGAMDAITAISVLEHVFDVHSFVRECCRLLKPRGILVLEVPNVAYLKHRIGLLFGRLPVTSGPNQALWASGFGWDGGHLHYFTQSSLVGLLTGEGLNVVSVGESRASFARQRELWPALLAGNFLVKAVRQA